LECLQSGGVSDNAGEAKTPRSSGHGIDNAADHLAKVNIEGVADNNHNEVSDHNQCVGDLDNSDGNILSPAVAISESAESMVKNDENDFTMQLDVEEQKEVQS